MSPSCIFVVSNINARSALQKLPVARFAFMLAVFNYDTLVFALDCFNFCHKFILADFITSKMFLMLHSFEIANQHDIARLRAA